MNFLRGNKVFLRALEPADIDLLVEWENDPVHWQVSGTLAPYSRSVLERFIENSHLEIYQTGQLRLIITDIETEEAIGTIDIFDFDLFNSRAGVGILIADGRKRNNGYATESLELIKEYCFGHLGINQLFCNIVSDNEASLRLFQKAGFELNGSKKAWVKRGDQYKDEYFLQLLKS